MGDGGELIPTAHSIWPVREEARGGRQWLRLFTEELEGKSCHS